MCFRNCENENYWGDCTVKRWDGFVCPHDREDEEEQYNEEMEVVNDEYHAW